MSSSTYPIIQMIPMLRMRFPQQIFLNIPRLHQTIPQPHLETLISDPSENLTQNLLAALAISPFYDDPYMKEILPPQKRARFLSYFSVDLAAPPHIFETRESSHKTPLERHEEQIITIMNHLDELPFERIKEMEDKNRGLGNGRQMGHDDEVVLARVRISTLQMIIDDIQVRHRSDIRSLLEAIRELKNNKMAPKRTSTSVVPAMTQAAIRKLVFDSVVAALKAQAAIPIGTPNKELAVLCPTMVPNSEKLIEVFIGELPRSVEGNVTA
nr:reverse transcriptase domain-containing protein [Tanacetum cinerariifolium]